MDKGLGLERLLGQNIINAHMRMKNTVKAQASFKEGLKILVRRGEWTNAASANTNLAGIVADCGETLKAIDMLETGLQHIAKEPLGVSR